MKTAPEVAILKGVSHFGAVFGGGKVPCWPRPSWLPWS
jgi:hypothetical protein